MNNSKKINIPYSSLVGLKAELLRKQAEVEELRNKNKLKTSTVLKLKVKKKSTKNPAVNKKKSSGAVEIDDVNELQKSKHMLEAKAKLYERLKRTHGDKSHNYLVDFSNKPISSSSSSEDEIQEEQEEQEDEYEDTNSDPECDWIEYKDCFGRSRKCLRKDLAKMQKKDKMIRQEITNEPDEPEIMKEQSQDVIPPKNELELEKLRNKWKEQTEKLLHKQDIHYQDILFDEARKHGVGYYAFSQDEDERLKQQENLLKLRQETEQRQKDVLEVKKLKEKVEENRLKAARLRQRIRAGLPIESDEEQLDSATSSSTVEASNSPEKSSVDDEKSLPEKPQENNSLCIVEDKIKAFGELLGKRPKLRELSQEEWMHKRRKDRIGEFAPVYENFKSGGILKTTNTIQITSAETVMDPLRLNAEGPEPTDLWDSYSNQENAEKAERSIHKKDINNSRSTVESFVPFCVNNTTSNFAPAYSNNNPSIFIQSAESSQQIQDPDEDSNDSGIIGPLPPPSSHINEADDLNGIPLPKDPPPPPVVQNSLNIEKISEGLKYLRKKFDEFDNR